MIDLWYTSVIYPLSIIRDRRKMSKKLGEIHPVKLFLSDHEWISWRKSCVTHKAIYLAGLRAYEEKRKR